MAQVRREIGNYPIKTARRRCIQNGVGDDLRVWCSWGRWAIDSILKDYRSAEASFEASERLIATIRRERQEAKGGLERFLAGVGTQTLTGYIRPQVAQSPG